MGTGSVAQTTVALAETLSPRCLSPFFRSPHADGPSQKGTGTVAVGRIGKDSVTKATEPVPICDCRPCAVALTSNF